jgi:transcription initiation factor TFIIB|tara:strand:- start:2123 stop:3043 length:921 start_codon:yes stop_codon:yes gene_type:complete
MDIDTSQVKCKECASRNLHYDQVRGERLCSDCGLLVEENIVDHNPEWRNFGGDTGGDKSRVGAPSNVLLHDKGLQTAIDWQNRDYSGAPLKSKTKNQMYRMRKWQRRSKTHTARERNLSIALSRMEMICSKLALPKSVNERSATIYRKALSNDLIRGRSIDAVVAACIFIANQQMQTARTVDDISSVTELGPKEIGRTYRDIKRRLMIKTPLPNPQIYIDRFCSELGMNSAAKTKASELVEEADRLELTHGKSPSGIAAAAIYIAGQLTHQTRTQRDIAEITNVTEVTIRNRYKQLTRALGIELIV